MRSASLGLLSLASLATGYSLGARVTARRMRTGVASIGCA